MGYDASYDAGKTTIGFKRTEGGRYGVYWEDAGDEARPLGEYDALTLTTPSNLNDVAEGGRTWIHEGRVAAIGAKDWGAILERLGVPAR